MTLWSERIQSQVCLDSLAQIEHLTPSSDECINDPDSAECDPCGKNYDYFMDKYDVYVLQNLLGIILKVSDREQNSLSKHTADLSAIQA